MSNNGVFIEEEADIVRLDPDASSSTSARSGWVNAGVHAIKIELDDEGNLTVEAYPRCNEYAALAILSVTKIGAKNQGAVDPDEDIKEAA